MTSKLSETERAEFQEIFSLVDKDRGGTITKSELGELMETLGLETSAEELDKMFLEVDQDGSGEIDFEEFLSVMSIKVNSTYTADEIKRAFRCFEGSNPSGFINAESLIKAICTYGSDKISKDLAEDLIGQIETDENGLINYKHFVDMILS